MLLQNKLGCLSMEYFFRLVICDRYYKTTVNSESTIVTLATLDEAMVWH